MAKIEPLFEQLARRFETYADDEIAIASRIRRTGVEARASVVKVETWHSAAKELREMMTNPRIRQEMRQEMLRYKPNKAFTPDLVRDYVLGDGAPAPVDTFRGGSDA